MKLLYFLIFLSLISVKSACAMQSSSPKGFIISREHYPEGYYYQDIELNFPFNSKEFHFKKRKDGRIVFYYSGNTKNAPLIISMGGIPPIFVRYGYVMASVRVYYQDRLTVQERIKLTLDSIRDFLEESKEYGFDTSRIVLMGFREHAMPAALLATDPSYLSNGPIDFKAIKAVVLLDPVCLDVAAQNNSSRAQRSDFIRKKCGGVEPAENLSPAKHAGAPNAGAFLMLPTTSTTGSERQVQLFDEALRSAGTTVRIENFELSSKPLFDALTKSTSAVTTSLVEFLAETVPSQATRPAE
ncbi:hypothetical protein [Sphingosinicella sp.]|uniref:hypothetical protein n=1 Tax=Sphingosinicella sp. TaxID=1917971 RepID=UPI0026387469|nr:hypothetical protein [Sphingosinicella sp.]